MDAQPTIMWPTQPDQLSPNDLVSYFQYQPERDTASDVRNALLVVMALIAAATFQACLNPPRWQVNQRAGTASFPSCYLSQSSLFLFSNTLAFSSSNYVISYLVYRFPFYMLIWIGLFSFSFTYLCSTPPNPPGAACRNDLLVVVALLLPLVMLSAW
ncbi:hypothetical protein CIPAW_16G063100 [Carya illinoinensis]|uniref:PGG domain-containing protein n=1 Tax=Carya illinoinensis TaxID=32201 RepID=A0A8T1N683_CARIL|nr:hypothetical protein CIPAW_16G063100 [Carya illinoinensis]